MESKMFDTVKIGKKIAELRKKKDMTQFELADRLGISYQAVSNWERGNSMPDISKLPELAEIFGVAVDEILGGGNPVVEKVTAGEPVQPAGYTKDELKEAAEVLRPSQVAKLAEEVAADKDSLLALAPFLEEEYVDELALKLAQEGEEDPTQLAPFMSVSKVGELALLLEQNGKDAVQLAPFMEEKAVGELAALRVKAGRPINDLLPFMEEEKLGETALAKVLRGEDITEMLPFLDERSLKAVAKEKMARGESITEMLPFLDDEMLHEYVKKALGR